MVRIYVQKGKEVFPKSITWNTKNKVVKSNLGFLKVLRPTYDAVWHTVGECIYCGGDVLSPEITYTHPITGEIINKPPQYWGECSSCGGV